MHDTCMATKTISLELDAYARLKRAKRSEKESFSSVVRRGKWDDEPLTGRALLEHMADLRRHPEKLLSESVLNSLDDTQNNPRRSSSEWSG
jgi:hypothetical protein